MAITKLPPIPDQSNMANDAPTLVPEITSKGSIRQPFKLRLRVTLEWLKWLQPLAKAVSAAPRVTANVWLSEQDASIASTAIPITSIPPNMLNKGLYRISWYLRVARAGTISSSIQLELNWTSGGSSITQTNAAVTGNLTTSYQSGSVVAQLDSESFVNYSTTYASAGATSMQYELVVTVEEIAGPGV